VDRILNNIEFVSFVHEALHGQWRSLIFGALEHSLYEEFALAGVPYTYSALAIKHHLGSSEFPELTPDQRDYWKAPGRSDAVIPIYNQIANKVMLGYHFRIYRQSIGRCQSDTGYTESVGIDPRSGDIVALGLYLNNAEDTLNACGYQGAKRDDHALNGNSD